MNKTKNNIVRALAVLLVLVLGISALPFSAFAAESATQNATENTSVDELDYIGDRYDLDSHVFDVLTFDRLNLLLLQSKVNEKSVIVFADDKSEVAKEAIPAINEKAQELGIEKIYYFDLLLAAENGVNIWDDPEKTWPNTTTPEGIPVSQDFVVVKKVLQDNTALGEVPDEFVAANDVFLFVLEGSEESQENNEDIALSASISASTLIQAASDINGIDATLNSVIENGVSIASNYSQFDYFNNDIWKSNASRAYYDTYEAYEDNFKLRAITIYELLYLLEQEGEYNILVSGSWCGDSKLSLPFVIENSSTRNSDTVYVVDFKLTGGFDQTWSHRSYLNENLAALGLASYSLSGVSFITTEGTARVTLTTHLGAKVMEKFGEGYAVGYNNSYRTYVVDGELTLDDNGKAVVEYATTTDKSFRSPYLARYNKDAEDPIVDTWLYQVTEYDTNIINEETQPIGSYKDYELNSGGFSQAQIAQGRYELALFFGAEDVSYNHRVPNISENPSADSGCGDENDTLDDQGQNTLIPYHGSKQYDVSDYKIDVTLNESAGNAANSTFKATAVITATAVNELNANNLSFDFRDINISSLTVKDITADKVISATYTQLNNDTQDRQKLNIAISENIAVGHVFEVTVAYTLYTVDYSVSEFGTPQGFTVHVDGKGYTAAGEPFGATYWFPCNNTPADGAKYEITLHAPAGYTLVSNGVKANTFVDDNGYDAVTWKVAQDTATYQVFATFSKNLVELKQDNTSRSGPLFKTADEREIPIYAYVNKDIYSNVEYRYQVDRYFALLPDYIRALEDIFGAYPGEALGFVFENIGDGNGGSAGWGAIETKDRPLYTSSTVTNENTFVHEFIHQWFGDAVRLNEWSELWLNEGFATLGTDLYFELNEDDPTFTVNGESVAFTTAAKFKALWESKSDNSIFWDTAVADIDKETYLFGGPSVAYNKGALALAILRDGLGDEAFLEILQTWVSENQGTSGTTEEFVALASRISGQDLTDYADAWLYGTVRPVSFTLDGGLNDDDGSTIPPADDGSSNDPSDDDGSTTNSPADDGSATNPPADDGLTGDSSDDGDNVNAVKIIVAIVAVVVIAGVVIFVAIGKKKSSGGGKCC